MVPASQPPQDSQTGLLQAADVIQRSDSSGSSNNGVIDPQRANTKGHSIPGGSKDTHKVKDDVGMAFSSRSSLPANSTRQHAADLNRALRK
jgi:hypothetical protein